MQNAGRTRRISTKPDSATQCAHFPKLKRERERHREGIGGGERGKERERGGGVGLQNIQCLDE